MQNIRKLINIIQKTDTPITLRKYDYDTKLQITLANPYNVLGLHAIDWDLIRTRALEYWKEEENVLTNVINDTFKSTITIKYLNILKSLLPQDVVPTIIVSILCQSTTNINVKIFSDPHTSLSTISDYLQAIHDVVMLPPISYSPVTTYVIDLNIEPYHQNLENGVSEIYWNPVSYDLASINEIFGIAHVWDHYDYPHIHIVDNFENHKYMLLNGIKRTWIASLELAAGIRKPSTRVNYGYTSLRMIPHYTTDQYLHLGKLNYGTVVSPPYDIARIRNMSLNEIETVIMNTLKCMRKQPTINTIYMTARQLAQEKALGNNPILQRYTLVLPITYDDSLTLYTNYSTNKLPIGLAFDVNELQNRIEITQNQIRPRIQPTQKQSVFRSNVFAIENLPTSRILMPREYKSYLRILELQTQSQFKISNILAYVAPTGYDITVTDPAEIAISYMVLNNSEGVILDDNDSFPTSILSLTQSMYAYDYDVSVQMLRDFMAYRQYLKNDVKSMNVAIVNAQIVPTTFLKLMHFNLVPVQQYSLDGRTGPQIDSLFSFSLMNSNMIYIVINENDYLNDINGYNLFTTDLHSGVMYILEFVDFSSLNLEVAVTSLIEAIQLITGNQVIKAQFQPLTLSPYSVGARMMFSLDDVPYITEGFSKIPQSVIKTFSRLILPSQIVTDPIQSLEYGRTIVPKVGTHLMVRCQNEQFNDALGYISSICRYVKARAYATVYSYYEIDGIVDQSRIACLDRLKMFRAADNLIPTQLLPQEINLNKTMMLNFSYFEMVTQTDRIQLYLYRKNQGTIGNDLSDYGSADYLNLMLTDNEYTMYDIDTIIVADIPGVTSVQGMLEWNEPLPYQGKGDVLIYNSLFLNARAVDEDLSVPILKMLEGVMSSPNLYFNLPYMTDQLYESLESLNIVELKGSRYYLKLGTYPAVPCLNSSELTKIMASFPSPQWKTTVLTPTLLDYYFTSRMIQRQGSSKDYFNAAVLHEVLPLFVLEKS